MLEHIKTFVIGFVVLVVLLYLPTFIGKAVDKYEKDSFGLGLTILFMAALFIGAAYVTGLVVRACTPL